MKFSLNNVAIAAGLLLMSQSAMAVPVDLELSLVIDISGSISGSEFDIQQDGYEAAFQSAEISNYIQQLGDAGTGGIAVNVIFFSSSSAQRVAWTQLDSAADSIAFGTTIGSLLRTPPSLGNLTGIAGGMNLSLASFSGNGFEGSRLTMDVSGDGAENVSTDAAVQAARDNAEIADIRVNGITVGGGATLLNYYDTNVITSDGFVLAATDFNDFESKIFQKIKTEITGAPEPSIVMLLGLGLVGFGFSRKQRRNS